MSVHVVACSNFALLVAAADRLLASKNMHCTQVFLD